MANIKPSHIELAQKILEFALESDLKKGDRLVEKRLADYCDVSRTPVRMALKLLEEKGAVSKSEERGYRLAVDPSRQAQSAVFEQPDENAGLADAILADRKGRRLGRSVTISELVRRYDASRNAVQKAVDVLQQHGVLRRAAGQAWMFMPMLDDPGTLRQSYEFRLALEPQAILDEGFSLDSTRAHAVRHQTDQLLGRGENRISAREFQAADFAFHDLIARSASNHFVADALITHARLRQMQHGTGPNDFRIRQALDDHLRMLDYIEQGQAQIAADLMRLHLRVSMARRPKIANRGFRALMQPLTATSR